MRSRLTPLLLLLLVACAPSASTTTPSPQPSETARPTGTLVPSATPLPTLVPTPRASSLNRQTQAMRPAFAADVSGLPQATRYWIQVEVEFDPIREQAVLHGLARVRYTNPGPGPLDDVVFMLWPNHEQYRSSMSAGPALIEGTLHIQQVELGGLAQRYALVEPLGAGESLDISLSFRVEAFGPIGFGSPHRFGISEGVLFAPTFYPLIPRNLDGEWELESAPLAGDTTNSEVAFYEVQVTSDAGYGLVTTGVEIDRQIDVAGLATTTVVSGPARDFALAMGAFVSEREAVGEVRINGWVLEQHAAQLPRMLRAAADQLELLSRLVGPYPYLELDLVDVPGAFGGIEYPGLVSIGTLGGPNLISPTIHEVGHQWFYGVIGADQLQEPWMDEGAATYTEVLYLEHHSGSGAATGRLADFREQLRGHPDPERPIGLPVAEYESSRDYGLFVYLKGALFFDALRAELGDEAFFDFLRAYYQQHRYQIASAADFLATAEASCACDLTALFDLWVYQGGPIPGL